MIMLKQLFSDDFVLDVACVLLVYHFIYVANLYPIQPYTGDVSTRDSGQVSSISVPMAA